MSMSQVVKSILLLYYYSFENSLKLLMIKDQPGPFCKRINKASQVCCSVECKQLPFICDQDCECDEIHLECDRVSWNYINGNLMKHNITETEEFKTFDAKIENLFDNIVKIIQQVRSDYELWRNSLTWSKQNQVVYTKLKQGKYREISSLMINNVKTEIRSKLKVNMKSKEQLVLEMNQISGEIYSLLVKIKKLYTSVDVKKSFTKQHRKEDQGVLAELEAMREIRLKWENIFTEQQHHQDPSIKSQNSSRYSVKDIIPEEQNQNIEQLKRQSTPLKQFSSSDSISSQSDKKKLHSWSQKTIKLETFNADQLQPPIVSYKIVLCGSPGVGKTSFVQRLLKRQIPEKHVPTAGVQVTSIVFSTSMGPIKVFFWDTAGDNKLSGLRDGYYINSNAGIIMFDVTHKASYEAAKLFYADLKRTTTNIPIVLVGNKVDEIKKQISSSQVTFPQQKNIQYYQTSAKLDYDLNKTITFLLRKLVGDPYLNLVQAMQSLAIEEEN